MPVACRYCGKEMSREEVLWDNRKGYFELCIFCIDRRKGSPVHLRGSLKKQLRRYRSRKQIQKTKWRRTPPNKIPKTEQRFL